MSAPAASYVSQLKEILEAMALPFQKTQHINSVSTVAPPGGRWPGGWQFTVTLCWEGYEKNVTPKEGWGVIITVRGRERGPKPLHVARGSSKGTAARAIQGALRSLTLWSEKHPTPESALGRDA